MPTDVNLTADAADKPVLETSYRFINSGRLYPLRDGYHCQRYILVWDLIYMQTIQYSGWTGQDRTVGFHIPLVFIPHGHKFTEHHTILSLSVKGKR
jgi:hypothetical protein